MANAAFAYGSVVFAFGFVLGVARTFLLAPLAGSTVAVALEAPIMIAISWAISDRVSSRCRVPALAAPRLALGILAFVILQAYEFSLAIVVFGRTLPDTFASLGTAAGAIGMASQIVFATIPVLQIGQRRSPARRRRPN